MQGLSPLQNATSAPKGFSLLGNVTLITGDKVIAYQGQNGSIRAAVIPAIPKSHEKFATIIHGEDMYVIPGGVNLRRFDLSLFDIRLLLNTSSYDPGHLGVIFQAPNQLAVRQMGAYMKARGYNATTIQKSLRLTDASISTLDRVRMHFAFLSLPRISKAWLDAVVRVQSVPWVGDSNMQTVGAPYAWSHSFNGSGSKIAILDTGIYAGHPDFFFPNGTSKIVNAVDFTDDGTTADLFGHGTHVASIAAGTGAASAGLYAGVAPGAALMNVKVLDAGGYGFIGWIVEGIQYAVANNATVISMSLGAFTTQSTDPLSQTANWAVQQGTAVVAAAGNYGPDPYTVTSPGVASGAITVGANDRSDRGLAPFSSEGPTLEGTIKPDITAPGVGIVGARDPIGLLSTYYPPYDQAKYYMQLSGTSMATPHVSGAYAVIRQRFPGLDPAQMKDLLVSTAADNSTLSVFAEGGGELNITAALTAQVLVSPAELNLKPLGGSPSGVVAVKDISASSVNLSLSFGGGSTAGAVTLNSTSLVLSPGATGHILVTANPSFAGAIGSVKVMMTDGSGRVYKAVVGVSMLAPLTIRKIDFRGNVVTSADPDTLAPYVYVIMLSPLTPSNSMSSFEEGVINSTGTSTVWVYPGAYELVSQSSADGPLINFLDSVGVSGPTSVTIDDRDTQPVSLTPGFPVTTAGMSSVELNLIPTNVTEMTIGWASLGSIAEFHVGQTAYWNLGAGYQFFGPGTPFGSGATYFYNLFYYEHGVSPGCCSFGVDPASTVDKDTQYRTEASPAQQGMLESWASNNDTGEFIVPSYLIKAPMAQHEITSASASYTSYYWLFGSDAYYYSEAGPHLPGAAEDVWGASPLLPSVDSEYFTSGHDAYLFFQVLNWFDHSNPTHSRYAPYMSAYLVLKDGSFFDGCRSFDCTYQNYLNPGPGKYEIYTSASMISGAFNPPLLSTSNFILYEFELAPGGAITAGPQVGRVTVYGLDMNDTEYLNPATVTFDLVNQSNIVSVSAKYSLNSGTTWRPANLTAVGRNYTMSIPVRKNLNVSLMMNATDARGNIGATVVYRAFAYGGSKDTVKVSCSRPSIMVLSTVQCTARVKGKSPGGAISWLSDGPGVFSSQSCNLKRGACSVSFVPLSGGNQTGVVAHYGGDFLNPPSATRYNLTVLQKPTRSYLSCHPTTLKAGVTLATCEAKVRGNSPTGTFTISQSGTGLVELVSNVCSLTQGICYFTVGGAYPGAVTVRVTYSGDSLNRASFATFKVRITR